MFSHTELPSSICKRSLTVPCQILDIITIFMKTPISIVSLEKFFLWTAADELCGTGG